MLCLAGRSGFCNLFQTTYLLARKNVPGLNYIISDSRSASLRTYAGDTSLPGGKVEHEDKTIEDTAVGSGSIPHCCMLNLVITAQRSLRRGR